MGATEILYGGRWHPPAGGQSSAVLNPSDGGELARVARGGEEDVDRAVAVIRFADEAEAVELANGTAFGLTAGVWTRDGGRMMRMAKGLECGQVFINNYGAGGGVELPFGGYKNSGIGREKGFAALHGYSQLKTVAVRHG